MFAMLEHHKPAKDIYDDGRLFLDFSEQTASLNGKPLTLSPMEYKMLNLFRKNPRQVLTRGQLLEKAVGYRRAVCGRTHPDNLHQPYSQQD